MIVSEPVILIADIHSLSDVEIVKTEWIIDSTKLASKFTSKTSTIENRKSLLTFILMIIDFISIVSINVNEMATVCCCVTPLQIWDATPLGKLRLHWKSKYAVVMIRSEPVVGGN